LGEGFLLEELLYNSLCPLASYVVDQFGDSEVSSDMVLLGVNDTEIKMPVNLMPYPDTVIGTSSTDAITIIRGYAFEDLQFWGGNQACIRCRDIQSLRL
jgi:hypothetical protein